MTTQTKPMKQIALEEQYRVANNRMALIDSTICELQQMRVECLRDKDAANNALNLLDG